MYSFLRKIKLQFFTSIINIYVITLLLLFFEMKYMLEWYFFIFLIYNPMYYYISDIINKKIIIKIIKVINKKMKIYIY